MCDRDEARLTNVHRRSAGVEPVRELDELLARGDIDAVAIATPVTTHAPMGMAALRAGKHVLLEKPLAASVHEAEQLVRDGQAARPRADGRPHVHLTAGPCRRSSRLLDSGELGDLYFIDSVRINLGMFQHDVNVVWDLAPHDLSILDFLVGRLPKQPVGVRHVRTPTTCARSRTSPI